MKFRIQRARTRNKSTHTQPPKLQMRSFDIWKYPPLYIRPEGIITLQREKRPVEHKSIKHDFV